MTAPSIRATGTVFGMPGGAGTTATILAPATIVAGDILVLICLTNASHTLSGLPSGWAHVTGSPVTSTDGSDNATLNVCWKRAVSGDVGATSYAFTLSGSDYAEGAISSVEACIATGSPWGTGTAPAFAKTSTASGTAPATSLTTTGADRLLMNGALNQTGGTPWTASSGYTTDFDHTGGGSFSTCTGYHKTQATAGATGNVQPVCPSSGAMVNFLGALLPVASATDHPGAVTPTVTATLAPTGVHIRPAAAAAAAVATLAPTPHQGHGAAISSAVTVGLAPAATHIRGAAIAATAAATLAPAVTQDHTAATTPTVTATLAAAATPVHPAAITADAVPALFLSPSGHNQGAITADVAATLEAAETHTRAAAVALTAVAGLIAAASSVGAHAISSAVIARMAATILANIVRDITVTYGQPELAWAFGPPELAWHLGTVET